MVLLVPLLGVRGWGTLGCLAGSVVRTFRSWLVAVLPYPGRAFVSDGGFGWGVVALGLGTSLSPKLLSPITASSVDGSLSLPLCAQRPRGAVLVVIGPCGPVFLTLRPSMLRHWRGPSLAFVDVQSTMDAYQSSGRPFRSRPPLSSSREFIFVVMLAVNPLWWADGGISNRLSAFRPPRCYRWP